MKDHVDLIVQKVTSKEVQEDTNNTSVLNSVDTENAELNLVDTELDTELSFDITELDPVDSDLGTSNNESDLAESKHTESDTSAEKRSLIFLEFVLNKEIIEILLFSV